MNSVVVDLEGLELVNYNGKYGHLLIDPKAVKKLNSEQKRAAQRIYGPDEENFGLNMEMFAETRTNAFIFVLIPLYVQNTLRWRNKKFVGRASCLSLMNEFYYGTKFHADNCDIDNLYRLRGVRRVIAEGDAPENRISHAPQGTEGVRNQTPEEILAAS